MSIVESFIVLVANYLRFGTWVVLAFGALLSLMWFLLILGAVWDWAVDRDSMVRRVV